MEFKKTIKIKEKVKKIEVSSLFSDILVRAGNNFRVEFEGTYTNGDEPCITTNIEDGKLVIDTKSTSAVTTGLEARLTVVIPYIVKKIKVSTVFGSINVTNAIEVEELKLHSNFGYICSEAGVNKLEADTVSGKIILFSDAIEIDAKSVSGSISIIPKSINSTDISVKTVSGNIAIGVTQNPNRFKEVVAEACSTSGKITEIHETDKNSKAILTIKANSISGDITID